MLDFFIFCFSLVFQIFLRACLFDARLQKKTKNNLTLSIRKEVKKKSRRDGFPPARFAAKSPERRVRLERSVGVRTVGVRGDGQREVGATWRNVEIDSAKNRRRGRRKEKK